MLAALTQKFVPRPVNLRVTPKGVGTVAPMSVLVMLPYIAIVVGLSGAALVGMRHHGTVGYIGLCILAAITYAIVCVAVPILHGVQASHAAPETPARAFLRSVRSCLPFCILAMIPLFAAIYSYPAYFMQVFIR